MGHWFESSRGSHSEFSTIKASFLRKTVPFLLGSNRTGFSLARILNSWSGKNHECSSRRSFPSFIWGFEPSERKMDFFVSMSPSSNRLFACVAKSKVFSTSSLQFRAHSSAPLRRSCRSLKVFSIVFFRFLNSSSSMPPAI